MIGGQDIVFPTRAGDAALDFVLRAIWRLWPTAVYEDAETGEVFDRYASLELSGRRELFVYRDAGAKKRWDEVGADEGSIGTMVHVLLSPDDLTLVLDETPPAELLGLLSGLRRSLRQDIFAAIAA